jgi:hypothetical protein
MFICLRTLKRSRQAINKGRSESRQKLNFRGRSLDIERNGDQLFLNVKRKAFVAEIEIFFFGN